MLHSVLGQERDMCRPTASVSSLFDTNQAAHCGGWVDGQTPLYIRENKVSKRKFSPPRRKSHSVSPAALTVVCSLYTNCLVDYRKLVLF
jgi:hypothetical protein